MLFYSEEKINFPRLNALVYTLKIIEKVRKRSTRKWHFEVWLKITLEITLLDARHSQQMFRVEKKQDSLIAENR